MKRKNFTTAFFLLLFASTTLGQRSAISLSFTGTANGQYAQLSKIDIRNLKNNCDTTLYWPDTVLSLFPVGMNDLHSFSGEFQVFQNVPNPVRENTKIMLYLPESGKVTIDVSLLSGKQVAFFSQELQRGYHSFFFTPGSAETYIFTASRKAMKKSIKIVSSPVRPSSACILIYNGAENEPVSLKSAAMPGEFTFLVGDTLLFIGYYDTLTTAFQDAPAINKTYTFNFPSTGISCPGMPAVSYMGQTYNTVQIGMQCWLRENLNIGTRIDNTLDQTDNGIIEKYCYNNDTGNCAIYGGLYQWNEMMQYVTPGGTKGICPDGWHLPTDAEVTTLTSYLGGESVASGKMKETGTAHWLSPNTNATNSSGFTALPGGGRDYNQGFTNLNQFAYFWSSSQYDATKACARDLYYNSGYVWRFSYYETAGFSARCLKD
jgi:uncharacterized protein (TIGR02145 family)